MNTQLIGTLIIGVILLGIFITAEIAIWRLQDRINKMKDNHSFDDYKDYKEIE